ncbi:hypothetical protein BLNAU_19245 [Blattamonas nauphoetae]|uniref:Right handed beta helix domain-containing protein n=1 Tax=Blattamonas nauphoetae TaxID=2049346 RepID=A0ABQ9X669_9EUKA|nr:hypothetical protein BLNAU_19245 [Blattamonas nauphoetae]
MVLLPLVRTSWCLPTPPRDSSSTDTPHSDNMSPFLSVCGAGLVLSNVSLILGTGPLLDFGLLSHDSTGSDEIGLGETSTLLVGSVLRNVTSRGCCRSGLVVARGLCQKLVGTSVTLSTSHLCGTGCLDINAFGSVGCVNTSFSHCSSSADSSEQFTHKHFKQDGKFVYEDGYDRITATFHLCTFTDMTSNDRSACVLVEARHDVTMTECSFNNIKGRFGGALYIRSKTDGDGRATISLCSFLNSTANAYGSALLAWRALYAALVATATISECVFMDCSANLTSGAGGALYVQDSTLSLTSVQFRNNAAKFGTDVYLALCGTRDEVEKRVSDCHTDKPESSLYFDSKNQTGIVQPFGITTTITNLEITPPAYTTHGQVVVETATEVEGTMLLLLDNTQPEVPYSEDAPPATCRVVVVNFPSLSTTGSSVEMSFGDSDRLQFPSTYSLIAASISATPIDITFTSPPTLTIDPPRVRKILCEPGTIGEMLVWLEGYKLEVGEYTIHFEESPNLSLNVTFSKNQAGLPNQESSSVSVGPGGEDTRFAFKETYKVNMITFKSQPVLMESDGFSLILSDLPRVRKILCQPGTIGELLVSLKGRLLPVGEYTIHFEESSSLTLKVTFPTNQTGLPNQESSSVSVGPGGTDTRFAFGETYKVNTITFDKKPVLMESDKLVLIIPPFETPFVIEVNKAEGGDGKCRGDDNSCGSLSAAFEAATKMGVKPTTLKLVTSDSLSNTQSISDENEVIVRKGGVARPSLIVPSTFSSRPLVVLSVSNASLTLTDVDALIRFSSLDLKLVSVSSGSFEFRNGAISFDSSSTANSEIGNADSDFCSWSTGTIEIVNSTALFKSCSLTKLTQGAIIQSGGNVTLEEVTFLSNGPSNKEFPSARRNVMCSSGGEVSVGVLRGDGGSVSMPGSGISGDGCSVSGTATTMSIVFLDTSESRITHDKKTGNFELELVGSGFLPCGLALEMFTSLEDGNSVESLTLVVDTDTASLFTETRIEFIVRPNDVANLSSKLEWKVRLLNGDSSIGTSRLVLREKPRSMLWLIPGIVVVVVVIVGVIVALLLIRRCRSKKSAEKKVEMNKTADEAAPTVTEPATDRPETENEAEPAMNVSDMPTKLTEEDTKESSDSPDRKI